MPAPDQTVRPGTSGEFLAAGSAPPSSLPAGQAARQIGRWAEDQACQEALARGWRVLDRNWRCRWGELDLVVWDGSQLVLVEVKCRRGSQRWGGAAAAVDRRKQQRLIRLARAYLQEQARRHNLDPARVSVRFDVYLVEAADQTVGTAGVNVVGRWLAGAFYSVS
ncbi:MAG: YraN family protein [Limnochordaceae bacterium]|nr:YraN family protein [Limnochordaceae bacterium]